MKRDLDLIRGILTYIENSEDFYVSSPIIIDGYNDNIIDNHIILLEEAYLIKGDLEFTESGSLFSYGVRLTNDGYEYISIAKNDKVWNKFKSIVKSKAIDASIEVSKQLLITITKELLN